MSKISVTIIEKHTSYTIIECNACDGTGRQPKKTTNNSTADCKVCDQRGKIKVSASPPFYECANCDGSGLTKDGHDWKYFLGPCSTCGGAGVSSGKELNSF